MGSYIYLASQSPRRREILAQMGVTVTPLLADADEDVEALEASLPNEPPDVYVSRVCASKAVAALQRLRQRLLPFAPILTADTTVSVGDHILGKPADVDEASRMLTVLSGRTHRVLTAVALVDATGLQHRLSISTVEFRVISSVEIERYIACGESFGKAGAYAIQGRAAEFIVHIAGSHSGIMGLPIFETAALLRNAGVSF